MKRYEIWSQGYRVNGNRSEAEKVAEITAESFRDACITYFDKEINEEGKRFVNIDNLSYYGCRLFDNESDARASYG